MSLSTIALLRQLIAVKIIHISSAHYQLSIVSSNTSYGLYQYYSTQEANSELFVKHLNQKQIFCRRD